MVVSLAFAFYFLVKIRASRKVRRPSSFIFLLAGFENEKEYYIFAILIIVGVLLGNLAVRL
jgi:hypothetical protein